MNSKKIWTLLILLIIIASFIAVDWEANQVHGNGINTIKKIVTGALFPDWTLIPKAAEAAVITLVYAATGLSIAIVIGFIIALYASNLLMPNTMMQKSAMNLLAFMRAIHELVWALFFVASIGLTPMAAVFAIAIPYGGMLGKVYTNLLYQVDSKKINAMKSSGANKLQLIVFGYIPEAYNHLVSYTLYRFECAIRSSTILSFVGLAGLGLKIQLTLGDLKYNETFIYVYTLIVLVLFVDIWSNLHRKYKLRDHFTGKIIVSIILLSWFYVGIIDEAFFDSIFNQKNFKYSFEFIKNLIGIKGGRPAYFNLSEIRTVVSLCIETLQMSILAITIASVMMISTVIFATRQYSNMILFYLFRSLYLVVRAIPELIWAMIIIFIIKPGIWAGALALAIHNFGILSKLCAEIIEDLEEGPLNQLKASGASYSQLLLFGVLPMASTKMMNYIIYRWEIIIRTTLIVGFVGAGGLGYYFKLNMSWFHYTQVSLVLIVYFILVKSTELIGTKLQKVYN